MSDLTEETCLAALELTAVSDIGETTIREYLHALLRTLWAEGEGFSGKRPFGNSGWDYDLYKPLVERGYVDGKLDEDGNIEHLDRKAARKYVAGMIDMAFLGRLT